MSGILSTSFSNLERKNGSSKEPQRGSSSFSVPVSPIIKRKISKRVVSYTCSQNEESEGESGEERLLMEDENRPGAVKKEVRMSIFCYFEQHRGRRSQDRNLGGGS